MVGSVGKKKPCPGGACGHATGVSPGGVQRKAGMARKPTKVASEHGVRVMASGELNIFYHSIAVVRIVDVVL